MSRPRSFDAEEVLAGAVEMFRERGYEGTSVPELTGRLGICRQSLYKTFGDKRQLYLKVLDHYGHRELDGMLALLEVEGSPLENVRTLLRSFASLATTCPSAGCMTVSAMVENRDDGEAMALVAAQVNRFEAGLARALTRAQEQGEIRAEAQPLQLARLLTTATYGMGLLVRVPGSGARIGAGVAYLLDVLAGEAV